MELQAHTDFGPDENLKIVPSENGQDGIYRLATLWAPITLEGKKFGFAIKLTGETKLDPNKRYNLSVTFHCEANNIRLGSSGLATVRESPEIGRFKGEDMHFQVKAIKYRVVHPNPK